jgi:phosphonopyruvate decarboxylase
MTRQHAVDGVLDALLPGDVLVATTGMISRQVYAYRQQRQQSAADFLTVGSMGHCSQIALGLAQHQPDRQVFCLDGDGAAIMHLGSVAIVGAQRPSNLRHIVLNNGAHESVGGQPTAGFEIDLGTVARACGYTGARLVTEAAEIAPAIARLRAGPGPAFLELRVRLSAGKAPPRPTASPLEQKQRFMTAIGSSVQ